jgi:alginate production protein
LYSLPEKNAAARAWAAVLAAALGTVLPAVAADADVNGRNAGSADTLKVWSGRAWQNLHSGDIVPNPSAGIAQPEVIEMHQGQVEEQRLERTAAGSGLRLQISVGARDDVASRLPDLQMAQFQLPPKPREGTLPPSHRDARTPELPSDLKFGYAYGSDTELSYRKDADLDKRLRDNFVWFAPTFFGFADYRPTHWLESRLELTLERIFPIREESVVTLPTGETVRAEKQKLSLLIDQAYVTFKNLAGPLDFTVGRRNFEDARLWLYDAALDAFVVKHKYGHLHSEASVSRENLVDGDLIKKVRRGRINNYMLYTEYRGIEDHKVAGYVIRRVDSSKAEGRPVNFGVRAYGRPSDRFNYWTELGFVRGKDELNLNLRGRAFDVGGTYRFPDLPLQPNVTLSFGYGSGDGNSNDNKNTEFRQTGLQSNEARFGGVTQFKAYGETIDPELSNLKLFTAGFGFRPAPNFFVDLVYHKYRANKIADQIRNWALTAQMNQDDTQLSKDVGREFDIILGFRNLFGLRKLGFEVRAGWFFPGKAFRNEVTTDPANTTFRGADKSFSLLLVIIL